MPEVTARRQLEAAAAALGLTLTAVQIDNLFAYLDLIQKWNKVYNLTSVRDPADMLSLHLIDSLAILAPMNRQLGLTAKLEGICAPQPNQPNQPKEVKRLLDVGSGAGLPGVVVAICCPDIAVTCVDTVAKKAAFINQVAVTLRLKNLKAVHARVENLASQDEPGRGGEKGGGFDIICCRAFSSLADFTALSKDLLNEQGIWLAMKARHPADEIAQLPPNIKMFHVEPLDVPGLQAERCLVWMRKTEAS